MTGPGAEHQLSLHAQVVDASTMFAATVAIITILWAWRGEKIYAALALRHQGNADDHNAILAAIVDVAPGLLLLLIVSVPSVIVFVRATIELWQSSETCAVHFCWESMDFTASLFFLAATSMEVLTGATLLVAIILLAKVIRELTHGGHW